MNRTTVATRIILFSLVGLFLLRSAILFFAVHVGDNHYLLQAESFLHGRLDLPFSAHEVALYKGKYYLPNPPFPAIVLLPFVAIFGVKGMSFPLISLGITILNVYLLYNTLCCLRTDFNKSVWILIAFFFGTAYLALDTDAHQMWYFGSLVGVTSLLLAIHEAVNQGRAWLVGVFHGMAILSRQMTLFAFPFLLVLLLQNPHSQHSKKTGICIKFTIPLLLLLSCYLALNWVRFDHPFDNGYSYILWDSLLKARFEQYGLFHVYYFPSNFIRAFLQGFHVEFTGAGELIPNGVDLHGTSLTFASPFVFIAFWARRDRLLLWSGWFAIGAMAILTLFYQGTGWGQFHAPRYSMDYMPILIVLVALGMENVHAQIWKFLILYAVFFNFLAIAICRWSRMVQ